MAEPAALARCPHGFLVGRGVCVACAPPPPKKRYQSNGRPRGDARRFHHPGFVDMTGQTIAGCEVLRRAANVNGNARWLVRAACGHELVVEGIQLRAAAKAGHTVRCKACRPKRPGTVRRRGDAA